MSAARSSAAKSSAIKSFAAKPKQRGPHNADDRAALELKASQPFFADNALLPHLLEARQIAVWSWDIRSKRLVWSSNIEEICGSIAAGSANAAEAILENDIHPEDRPAVV